MHFRLSAATAAMVMATSAFAQETTSDFDPVTSPSVNQTVPTSQGFAVTWTHIPKYDGVKVMIELIGGHYQDGQTHRAWVTPEGTTIDNKVGTYTWTVGSEHGELPCYGLKIISADQKLLQYSPPFFIGSKKHCPKTLGAASSSVGSSSASPATSTVSAATGYAVVTPAVAPKATGAEVPAPKASVNCNNATGIAKAGTPGASGASGAGVVGAGVVGAAGPGAAAGAAAGAAKPSSGLAAASNSTGSPVTVKNGASLAQAGFLSVFGAVAVALAL